MVSGRCGAAAALEMSRWSGLETEMREALQIHISLHYIGKSSSSHVGEDSKWKYVRWSGFMDVQREEEEICFYGDQST